MLSKGCIRGNNMIESLLEFGYNQCAKLGYVIGFGAREGLVIYLGILGILLLEIFNSISKSDK